MGEGTDPGSLAGRISELTRVSQRVERRVRQFIGVAVGAAAAVIVVVVIGGLLLVSGSADRDRLHRLIDGDCQAFAAIGTLDVPASAAPALHRIVDSQRGAYNRRCVDVGGPLPPVRTLTPTPTR